MIPTTDAAGMTLHTKKPWRDPDSHNTTTTSSSSSSEHRSPESRHSIGPAKDQKSTLPIPAEHRLPPIATTFDTQRPRPQEFVLSAEPEIRKSSRPASPLRSPFPRPEKRARWQYSQDSTPTFGHPADAPTYMNLSEKEKALNRTAWARSDDVPPASRHGLGCPACGVTQDLVRSFVARLLSLEGDIRHSLALSKADHNITGAEVDKFGLKETLSWASDIIYTSQRLVREVASSSPRLPSLGAAVATEIADPTPTSTFSNTSSVLSGQQFKRRASVYEKDRSDDPIQYHPSNLPEYSSRLLADTHFSSSQSSDQMKRTYQLEPPPVRPGQSPGGPSPPLSAYASTQSPPASQPFQRTLPSPATFQYPPSASSGTTAYSDPQQSAQTAHLQDLQHQISTKTLALQTLQREHDQLLAAFSRSQIRCTTLDKKSQVSDHEINTLSEEKIRLQQQVEALETQVEELVRARDEAHQQSTADGAQWQRIMTMSSQLQIRSAAETRQYRSDREAWERDREGLEQRILQLEAGNLTVPSSHAGTGSVDRVSPDDILASASLDVLREEIVRLRRSCSEMGAVLQEIKGETDNLSPALATLANIRERISAKTRSGLHESRSESEEAS